MGNLLLSQKKQYIFSYKHHLLTIYVIYIIYKYAIFDRNSIKKENFQIFNTDAATNHLLDIPLKETTDYGTYFMRSTASMTWNDLLRKTNENFLDCRIGEFKRALFQTYLAKSSN